MSARQRSVGGSGFSQAVLPLFEASRADWLAKARAVAHRLGNGGRTVTINDVRAKCPPPEQFDPRVNGAVFVRSEWANIGYEGSNRSASHNRPVARFRRREFME